jgi:hypothetical protein
MTSFIFLLSVPVFPKTSGSHTFRRDLSEIKSRSQQTEVLPAAAGKSRRICVARILFRDASITCVREEEYYIRQSAEQLDLQKNILRIGFDSSTDFQTLFKV